MVQFQTEEKEAARRPPNRRDTTGKEPVDITRKRRAAVLREYGYSQTTNGLYSVREGEEEGKEVYTLIGKLHADVLAKRHVYTVPEYLSEQPKEQGVVLVTQFSRLDNQQHTQVIEIHRSDTLSRQPKFLEQIQVVVPPHKRQRDTFIHALEAMAMLAPIEKRYNATGLIHDGSTRVFLQPTGGGITSKGLEDSYRVQFPLQIASRLTSIKYGWKCPSPNSERIHDYITLLRMLDIAPGSTGYGDVLLGVHGFAPMSQLCETGGVWAIIHGITGSKKSATSRLPLQGYAIDFYGRQETSTINLREGASTAYAIEQVLYYLSGMFAHLDDGLKGNNVPQKEIEKFYKMISTIGGHAVTRQGGKRGVWGQGEGGFGIEPYPRGSGVYTVETLPASEGHASDLARYIVASLDGTTLVDETLLTELQTCENAQRMNRATLSYIMWLLPRMEKMLATVAEREEIYRAHGIHSRTPTSYAKLELGIAALLHYGVSIGAHTQEEAKGILEISRAKLVHVALNQKALMGIDEQTAQANDLVYIFYKLLLEAMRTPARKLYVSDATYRTIPQFTNGEVTGSLSRTQPPLFLSDESIEHGLDSLPDNYGWKFSEALQTYEPLGVEAGVLEWDGVKPVLRIYVSVFRDTVYTELNKLAKLQDIPLPGLNEMVAKLRARGKLTSLSTHLHGRNSKKAGVYVLDLTPEPENVDELATGTSEDGTLHFDLDD